MSDSSPARLRLEGLSAILGLSAAIVLSFWIWELFVPHMVEQAEVRVCAMALWWKSGWFPYAHPTQLPLLANPYGPVFTGVLSHLPVVPGHPYLLGRLLSIVSVLTALALVSWWVKRRTGDSRLALLCALLPLIGKPMLLFGALYRVDSLALVLSLAGFCFATISRSRRSLVLAWLLLLLGFATKTSQIAAPVAVVLYLWTVDRKRAQVLGAAIALSFPAFVFGMEYLSGGAYLANAALGNVSGSVARVLEMAVRPMLVLFWLLALIWAARPRWRRVLRSAAFLYVLACWITSSAFGYNPMTSANFLMEFYIALGLLTGEILGGQGRASNRWTWRLLTVHGVIALLLVLKLISRETRTLSEYRPRFEVARGTITGIVGPGDRVAVLDSMPGRDVLNALGSPNPVTLPPALETSPEVVAILREAIEDGGLDFLLVGDDLKRIGLAELASNSSSEPDRLPP